MTQIIELPRQVDGQGYYLIFTGGFRAANVAHDAWRIEPLLVDNKPCATGPDTMGQLQTVARQNSIRAVAFHLFGWLSGVYYSSWSPIIPGETSHFEGPARLWNNIAGNISDPRTKDFLGVSERPTEEEIAITLDDKDPVEALAQYIRLSLRSMDISVEQIAEHYHEQLVNHLAAGHVDGERSANTLSQTLFAHVHSFFLHLGAARDFLGALVAYRIGLDAKKVDSMARLDKEFRQASFPSDALLSLLLLRGDITAHPQKEDKFSIAGWMQEVTTIRNELV